MNSFSRMLGLLRLIPGLAVLLMIFADANAQEFQDEFNLSSRKLTDTGEAKYFVLTPGFQIVLANADTTLTLTVLNETKTINNIVTRVVEEKEEQDGAVSEIARNYYAMDSSTGDVFHFGEDIDAYEKGKITGHAGSWMAYKNGSKPGMEMPGAPKVGMKFYQEIAPGVIMDRSEIISLNENLSTKAGQFKGCLKTKDTSKLHADTLEYRLFAAKIGLAQFEDLKLVRYGK
jgi:hypothetical protein